VAATRTGQAGWRHGPGPVAAMRTGQVGRRHGPGSSRAVAVRVHRSSSPDGALQRLEDVTRASLRHGAADQRAAARGGGRAHRRSRADELREAGTWRSGGVTRHLAPGRGNPARTSGRDYLPRLSAHQSLVPFEDPDTLVKRRRAWRQCQTRFQVAHREVIQTLLHIDRRPIVVGTPI
jgi:hypothetical protein